MHVDQFAKEQMGQRVRRLYLLYHELRPGRSAYSYAMDTETFEGHLDLFARLRADGAGVQPEVTFDDGHISNLELAAPLLLARGLTARFFITVGWTGTKPGFMGWDDLRALQAAGHAIGAHGWSHTLLTHCGENELQRELGEARRTLEDKLGTAVVTMSLPGGRCNRRVLAACEEAGYTQVYTSEPRAEEMPLGFTVGRLNLLGEMQAEWVAKLFEPGGETLGKLRRQYRAKAGLKRLLGDGMYAKVWGVVNRKERVEDGEAGQTG